MKTKPLATLISAATVWTATALAAPDATPAAIPAQKDLSQFEVHPKNLARQHLGANLFHYQASNHSYTPTEAAAAWLDDDISTGWPMLAGKQYYLLALPNPELLTNFCLSARSASGTIALYAGSEPAPPGAKTWTSLAHDIPFESINGKRLEHGFNLEAKYLLIETNVSDPGPVYSLYLYGEKPAVAFNVTKRDRAIDARAIFGPFVNEQTSINLASLYAQTYVAHSDSGSLLQWQKVIDDNPESSLVIAPSPGQPNVSIRYQTVQEISRISLLADPGTKGKLEFFLVNRAVAAAAPAKPQAAPAVAPDPATAPPPEATPTVSIVLDGTNPRTSIDFPSVPANEMLIRWTPENGSDSVNLHEIETFGTPTLTTYSVAMKSAAIAEGPATPGPYLPGALRFPPNILVRTPDAPPQPPSPPPLSQ